MDSTLSHTGKRRSTEEGCCDMPSNRHAGAKYPTASREGEVTLE